STISNPLRPARATTMWIEFDPMSMAATFMCGRIMPHDEGKSSRGWRRPRLPVVTASGRELKPRKSPWPPMPRSRKIAAERRRLRVFHGHRRGARPSPFSDGGEGVVRAGERDQPAIEPRHLTALTSEDRQY